MASVSLVAHVSLELGLGFGTKKKLSNPLMTSLSSVYMGDVLENGRGAKGSGALRLDQKPDPLGGHWTFWVIRFLEKLFSKMAGLPPPKLVSK